MAVAKEAGAVIAEAWNKPKQIDTKSGEDQQSRRSRAGVVGGRWLRGRQPCQPSHLLSAPSTPHSRPPGDADLVTETDKR